MQPARTQFAFAPLRSCGFERTLRLSSHQSTLRASTGNVAEGDFEEFESKVSPGKPKKKHKHFNAQNSRIFHDENRQTE